MIQSYVDLFSQAKRLDIIRFDEALNTKIKNFKGIAFDKDYYNQKENSVLLVNTIPFSGLDIIVNTRMDRDLSSIYTY